MQSPFPGMDPFLESRWESVHGALAIYAGEVLNRHLPTGLLARSGERAIVTTDDDYRDIIPDVSVFERGLAEPSIVTGGVAVAQAVRVRTLEYTIKQRYVEIRATRPEGGRVITVIEFVSPTNKRPGEGLTKYKQKQQECREGGVNLVEIDLTRSGDRSLIMPLHRLKPAARTTYQAWVSRASELQTGWAYCLPLTTRLAAIPIPLRPSDSDVLLDLQPLVDHVYESGRYSVDIDYTEPFEPPLSPNDAEWVASILAQRPSAEAS